MRLSTKSSYAITAILELALNGMDDPITLADISKNQDISLSYLEQLFAALRKKQLVRGVRGPGGGYYLGRKADEISIADVICAIDEWVEFTRCNPNKANPNKASISNTQRGMTHHLWDNLSQRIYLFLADITLADLIEHANMPARDTGADADIGIKYQRQAA